MVIPEVIHGKHTFGYFSRHKYKDLVFYVKTGEHSNCGLFEMEDTEENRALMDDLLLNPVTCPTCSKQEDRQQEAPMGDA